MLINTEQATVIPSDGVTASLNTSQGGPKSALRVDYAFAGGGYFTIRVPVHLTLPNNYEFRMRLSGTPSENTVEVKLFDPTDNVWWVERRGFTLSKQGQPLVNKKRHFSFAWGTSKEPQHQVAFFELTVKSGALKKGSVYLSDLNFNELPPVEANPPQPVVTASSGKNQAGNVLHPEQGRSWHSGSRERQSLCLDFAAAEPLKTGTQREFGGLVIDWGTADYAIDYDVQFRSGKGRWQTVDTVRGARGSRQYHYLPESETSAVRLLLLKSSAGCGYEIKSVTVKPLTFATSVNNFLFAIAPDFKKGHLPRYLLGEQTYWTLVGVSGSANEGLLNEEGMFELGRQMPALEPFLIDDGGKLLTWADGIHSQSLVDDYLPMPTVNRKHKGMTLTVSAFAHGKWNASTAYARYTVKNDSDVTIDGALILALRNFQVNPPSQFLNNPGGYTPIRDVCRSEHGVEINNRLAVVPLTAGSDFGSSSLSRGEIVDLVSKGQFPIDNHVQDAHGFASCALRYDFSLAAGECRTFDVAVPLHVDSPISDFASAFARTKRWWENKLASVKIKMAGAKDLVNTIKSQVAYILINREGPAIQPGKRSYMRTWIRDGAMTGAALLQQGLHEEVRDFLLWFAPNIYANGKVPCCVDKHGADPTPENDSHGEFIYLVAEYYRHTKDRQLLAEMFPHVRRAVAYIDELRQTHRTEAYKQADKAHLWGLLSPSISHEGYSDRPAESYFDDIFADVGLRDAVYLASELGDAEAWQAIKSIQAEFHSDLIASIRNAMAYHKIDFIPGAADRGDFDATSTTIALDPDTLNDELPEELRRTFAKYWDYFAGRQAGTIAWSDYTPYEWRSIGSFLRLNQTQRAHEALAYFMNDRRPLAWNHWAEVVGRDPLTPRFLGDMPHGWVGSDFLRSVRSLFVYERANAVVVGRGLKLEWLLASVEARELRTHFGTLSIVAQATEHTIEYELTGNLTAPVLLALPEAAKEAVLNGQVAPVDTLDNTVLVSSLPAKISIIRS
jgi:hypothetical protein